MRVLTDLELELLKRSFYCTNDTLIDHKFITGYNCCHNCDLSISIRYKFVQLGLVGLSQPWPDSSGKMWASVLVTERGKKEFELQLLVRQSKLLQKAS